jgi:phosphoglycolate phosphatase
MIKGVIFDKDGTLFDFGATWESWAKAFLLRATSGDRNWAQALGQAIGFDFERAKFAPGSIVIAGTPGEIADALLPMLPQFDAEHLIDLLNQEAAEAPQAEAVPLIPLLTGLRGLGLRLGVATNDAERPARAHLDKAGVTDLFEFIAGFDSGFGGKPEPGQLLGFARQVGLDPAQVVMVGDSAHDLLAGRAAGMQVVGVLTGMASAGDLAPLADEVLPDIGALPDWIAAANSLAIR